MKVLITGGAGYIGSHVAHALRDYSVSPGVANAFEMAVLDNFCSGQRRAIPEGVDVIEGDVGDPVFLARVFSQQRFDAVLHFAAHVRTEESVSNPSKYYQNNTAASLALFTACANAGIEKLIFSSTAAVYGEPATHGGLSEEAPLKPINPYGSSKMMAELILRDIVRASQGRLRTVVFRYFNAAGGRRDLKVGQSTPHATHLIKIAAEVALGLRPSLTVNGTDYPTADGTCERDYIHIEDLASAHLAALHYLVKGGKSVTLNAGYGQARSVLQVIESMKRVSGHDFKVINGERRPGDASLVMADCKRIQEVLGWRPQFNNLDLICQTTFEWEKKLKALRASGEWV